MTGTSRTLSAVRTADVDAKDIAKLKDMLAKYEDILKLLE
jgi:hypothetical protein